MIGGITDVHLFPANRRQPGVRQQPDQRGSQKHGVGLFRGHPKFQKPPPTSTTEVTPLAR